MKHGDKTKKKPAKASKASKSIRSETPKAKSGKTSGKKGVRVPSSKASQKVSSKGSAKGQVRKGKTLQVKTGEGERNKSKVRKTEAPAKSISRPEAERSGFTNSFVASAFKRAVKKYSNALRRLTD
jgi:hypothetical protein